MSRRSDTGRFTGNPETQGNATEEENSIERAFAAANGLDEVMMGGTQTPMSAQKTEFAGSPRQETKRTVLATRKKAQLTERLNTITEEIEATEQEAAKELFAEWVAAGKEHQKGQQRVLTMGVAMRAKKRSQIAQSVSSICCRSLVRWRICP